MMCNKSKWTLIAGRTLLLFTLAFGSLPTHAIESLEAEQAVTLLESSKPLALVYWGPGACLSCWMSAAAAAKQAGFRVKMVGTHVMLSSLLTEATLWVQPGGKSQRAALAMGSNYLKQIKDFVKTGGAYVGFCAGAFLSTAKIGESNTDGLGIVAGHTILWDQSDGPSQITPILWNGKIRHIYYHGGPFFDISAENDPNLHPFAYYHDGKINALTTVFGRGRVAVTGAHPEASAAWKFFMGKKDPDGSDRDLVAAMMKWATASP